MTIIAVSGVPLEWEMRTLLIRLAKCIRGQFEGLNFAHSGNQTKTAYIRLSESLQPHTVIANVKRNKFKHAKKQFYLEAFIPDHLTNLQWSTKPTQVPPNTLKHFGIPIIKSGKIQLPKKPRTATRKTKLRVPIKKPVDKVVMDTHYELMAELQCKFTGLLDLSAKSEHMLLLDIGEVVFDTLKNIVLTADDREAVDCGFKLSKLYRKRHPHYEDFRMILSCLHRIEDSDGMPRTQLSEKDLIVVPKQIMVGELDVPFEKVNKTCVNYSFKITEKIRQHMKTLKEEVAAQPPVPENTEDAARQRVKEELIKMSPYIEMILHQVMTVTFVPQTFKETDNYKMRMYGEPYLPSKEALTPILKKHTASGIARSDVLYNVLRFCVPRFKYVSLIELDGTLIGGSTVRIRASEFEMHRTPAARLDEMQLTIQRIIQ